MVAICEGVRLRSVASSNEQMNDTLKAIAITLINIIMAVPFLIGVVSGQPPQVSGGSSGVSWGMAERKKMSRARFSYAKVGEC